MHTLLLRAVVIVVFLHPTLPPLWMLILISICTSFTEVLSVTVPGGRHSQGGHGYLLGLLAAHFCFIRHLPHTHLLLMGLITACMGTSNVIHLVVFFFHFCFQLKQSGFHKITSDVHVCSHKHNQKKMEMFRFLQFQSCHYMTLQGSQPRFLFCTRSLS